MWNLLLNQLSLVTSEVVFLFPVRGLLDIHSQTYKTFGTQLSIIGYSVYLATFNVYNWLFKMSQS